MSLQLRFLREFTLTTNHIPQGNNLVNAILTNPKLQAVSSIQMCHSLLSSCSRFFLRLLSHQKRDRERERQEREKKNRRPTIKRQPYLYAPPSHEWMVVPQLQFYVSNCQAYHRQHIKVLCAFPLINFFENCTCAQGQVKSPWCDH